MQLVSFTLSILVIDAYAGFTFALDMVELLVCIYLYFISESPTLKVGFACQRASWFFPAFLDLC